MYHYEKITYLIEEAGRALVKRYYVITLQWDLFAYCHKWKCCTLNTHASIFFLGWYPITFSVYIVSDKQTCRASGHYIKSCVKRYDILLHYMLYRCMHLQLKVQDYSYFTALNLALNNPIIIHNDLLTNTSHAHFAHVHWCRKQTELSTSMVQCNFPLHMYCNILNDILNPHYADCATDQYTSNMMSILCSYITS